MASSLCVAVSISIRIVVPVLKSLDATTPLTHAYAYLHCLERSVSCGGQAGVP